MADRNPADRDPADTAIIARIAAHMNKDHKDSISDYAQFYARLPEPVARTATLTDMSFDHLTLSVTSPRNGAKGTVYIALNPPMKSFSESRERLIVMAAEALEGLGRSKYVVKEFRHLSLVDSLVAGAVLSGYWAFWNGDVQFAEGGFLRDNLFQGHAVADILLKSHMYLFWGVLSVHTAEATWMHFRRLRKHGVPTGSGLWAKWMFATFIEGFGSIRRFNAEVRSLEKAEKAKEH